MLEIVMQVIHELDASVGSLTGGACFWLSDVYWIRSNTANAEGNVPCMNLVTGEVLNMLPGTLVTPQPQARVNI